jgi:hypothetical protein
MDSTSSHKKDSEERALDKDGLRSSESSTSAGNPQHSNSTRFEPQNTNSVYDKNDEKPIERPDLKALEGASSMSSNSTGSGSTQGGASTPTSGSGSSSTGGGSWNYNKEDGGKFNNTVGQSEQPSPSPRRLRFKGKGSSSKKTNKWLIGGITGGSGAIFAIVIALIILAGAYKIVDFAEHVAAYQFARSTAQNSEDVNNITDEEAAIASLPDDEAGNSVYNAIKEQYTAGKGEVSDLWSNLDKYRPGKIIQNFQNDKKMTFNEETTKLGRPYIKSVTINGEEIPIQTASISNSLKNKLIPGYKFANDVRVSQQLAPQFNQVLDTATDAGDVSSIVSGLVPRELRSELDIGWVAWNIGKYTGKSQTAADEQVEDDTNKAAQGNQDPTNSNVPDKVNDEAKTAEGIEQGDLASASGAASIVKTGGAIPGNVLSSINNEFTTALFTSIEGFISLINPIYKYATPLCLIYDGSLQNSGPTIDNENQQLERSGLWVQSAAAQEKDGSNVNGEAVGATDWKLADITKSNAEERASGIRADTSSSLSSEASPTGQYSIADYGLGSTVGGLVDDFAGPICPVATNIWAGIGIGVVGIFAGGIGDAISDEAVNASAGSLISAIGSNIAKSTGSALGEVFSIKTAATLGVIGAGTVAAKMLVASQISATHNSLATGKPYDDDVDDGTNLYANQVDQHEYYGAPLTDTALGPDNTTNELQLGTNEGQFTTAQKFASMSDPNSYISRLSVDVAGIFNSSLGDSFLQMASKLVDPLRAMGTLFNNLSPATAMAATPVTSANTYYGNVQFGFTAAEKNLLDSCPEDSHDPALCTYQPLENQLILDQSGNESAIDSKFGTCFTASMGQLLSSGDIVRDDNGDVIADQGLCSPDNLGIDSPDSLGVDNSSTSPEANDMIFRYRVAKGYDNTLEQLNEQQTVTADDYTPTNTNTSCSNAAPASSQDFFTVSGNEVCDNGDQFIPYGTSVNDNLVGPDWTNPKGQQATYAQIQAAALYWHVNTIRIQVSEADIMGNSTSASTYNQAAMANLLTQVNAIEALNKIPVISDNNQQTDPSETSPTQRTIAFWGAVTQYLSSQPSGNYTNVIFDIFNEPSDTSWAVWKNGGSGSYQSQPISTVGMQAVVSSIRGLSNSLKDNLIWAEGPETATTLAELDSNQLSGSNIEYSYHHVDFTGPSSQWMSNMGLDLTIKVPIVDGEWAQYASSRAECYPAAPDFVKNYLSVLTKNNIGLIFWSLEPGVGTDNSSNPQPVSDKVTPDFPQTAAGYSEPTTFENNYQCTGGVNTPLINQGAGATILNYFGEQSGT